MSGSSGGGGGSGPEPIRDCGSISFNTDINSPQAQAVQGLQVRDTLDVQLNNNKVEVVRQDSEDTVGSINWSSITRLIECIEQGNEYVAVVRDIQGGLIKIHVSAK